MIQQTITNSLSTSKKKYIENFSKKKAIKKHKWKLQN